MLSNQSLEILSHGWTHIDLTKLSLQNQGLHIRKSKDILEKEGILPQGFRAPYLHWNEDTIRALKENDIPFHSSAVFFLKGWEDVFILPDEKKAFQKAFDFYHPFEAATAVSRPYYHANGILEIPVGLPDDEILIDRMGVRDPVRLRSIWQEIFEQIYNAEGLWTLQLHPERIPFLKDILIDLCFYMKDRFPRVWMASLTDIYRWWVQRPKLKIIREIHGSEVKMRVLHRDRHTLLISRLALEPGLEPWDDSSHVLVKDEWTLRGMGFPVIGLHGKALGLAHQIQEWGYLCEAAGPDIAYNLIIGDEDSEKDLHGKIKNCQRPLLRVGYWPDHFKSAFCMTGDIDCVTLQDFFMRLVGK